MFRHYLTTAWRNILKNGMFSFINIFGLALALMSCILIILFVREESGFDKWVVDNDRIVRMHTAYLMPDRPPFLTVRSAGSMMEAVRDYATAEVEAGVRLVRYGATVRKNEDAFSEQLNVVDGSFFSVFDLPFVYGSKETSFNKPFDLVITEEKAIQYFGRTDVVGEMMTICCNRGELATLPVTGVIRDLPQATHLDLDMVLHQHPSMFSEPGTMETWTSVNVYTYFKMRPGTTLEQLQHRLTHWVNNESPFVDMYKQNFGEIAEGVKITDSMQHRLMLLTDLHLNAKRDAGNMGDLSPLGDRDMIYTFTVVAILILIIACINFMNLATARASQRAKEVAMRKVLGASRAQVAVQFLGEAICLVFIALVFSLVLVEVVLPFYNDALNRTLEMHLLSDPELLFSILGVGVFVGVGAGSYPALFLSRFLPGHFLKSSKGAESGGSATLRTGLVIFQFAASIALVVCTAVIYSQTRYAQSVDVGYVSDDKLILNLGGAGDARDSLRQELLNLPEISSVVYSSESPTQDNENNTQFTLLDQGAAGKQEVVNYHNMGFGFFDAYEIEPVAGRLFDEKYGTDQIQALTDEKVTGNANIILNASAARTFGFNDPQQAIGKTLESNVYRSGNYHLTIVGVIPDIYFRSIKFSVRPTVFMMNPSRFRVASLTFNTSDVPGLMSKVEEIWKRNVPMQPIDLQFLSEMMNAQYQDEQIQTQLFLAFSVLAIVIACLGLYGLAAFTTERRTREIGIRKVMGAGVTDIVTLLIWQFSKPVIWANLLAWPISIYAMLRWLEAFPYRIDSVWLIPICLVVGVGLLLIAWATVGGNAARVARANPVRSLRQE